MMRLATVVFLGSLLLLGGGGAWCGEPIPDELRYWYLDIHEPFFKVETSSGATVLVNGRPGSRETRMSMTKPDGGYRVFLIGGSVANRFESHPPGRRDPTLVSRLERVLPGKKVELINCGMNGYDSYRDSLVFDQVLARSPDLIVLMSGNNDFSSSAGEPPRTTRVSLRLRGLLGLKPNLGSPASAGAPRPPAQSRVLLAGNLRRMAREAKERGVPLVLCTLPRRLGQPPSGPLPLWNRIFFDAWTAWEKRDWAAAEAGFARYLKTAAPDDYMARYYAGRCREARGDRDGALAAYRDALMPDVNQVIREVAREEGTLLADLEAAFLQAAGSPRLERQFSDTVHWLRAMDPLVSDTVVRAVRPGGAAVKIPAAALKEGQAFESRVLSAFWEASAGALGQAEDRLRPSEAAVWMLESLWDAYPARMGRLRVEKEVLHRRYLGNPSHIGGKEEFEPLWASGLAHLGEAAARKGRLAEAVRDLEEALAAAPDSPGTRLRLAVWLARSGRRTEARESFRELRAWKERLPEAEWYREILSIPEGD